MLRLIFAACETIGANALMGERDQKECAPTWGALLNVEVAIDSLRIALAAYPTDVVEREAEALLFAAKMRMVEAVDFEFSLLPLWRAVLAADTAVRAAHARSDSLLRHVFKVADVDRRNSLSVEQYRAALVALASEPRDLDAVRTRFAQMLRLSRASNRVDCDAFLAFAAGGMLRSRPWGDAPLPSSATVARILEELRTTSGEKFEAALLAAHIVKTTAKPPAPAQPSDDIHLARSYALAMRAFHSDNSMMQAGLAWLLATAALGGSDARSAEPSPPLPCEPVAARTVDAAKAVWMTRIGARRSSSSESEAASETPAEAAGPSSAKRSKAGLARMTSQGMASSASAETTAAARRAMDEVISLLYSEGSVHTCSTLLLSMDENRSGRVSRQEMREGLKQHGLVMTEEVVRRPRRAFAAPAPSGWHAACSHRALDPMRY